MALTAQEKKARQRATPQGYAKSRQSDWKRRGIKDISYMQYLEKIVEQHSSCSICGRAIDSTSALDHDHLTGQARGVLCGPCNLMIGSMNDNAALLRNAANYLDRWAN